MNITLNGIRRDDSFNKSAAFQHVSKDHINYFDSHALCLWHKTDTVAEKSKKKHL